MPTKGVCGVSYGAAKKVRRDAGPIQLNIVRKRGACPSGVVPDEIGDRRYWGWEVTGDMVLFHPVQSFGVRWGTQLRIVTLSPLAERGPSNRTRKGKTRRLMPLWSGGLVCRRHS